jgi:hypothetical protein
LPTQPLGSMGKVDEYREILRGLRDWDDFLLEASGLPGPRGNLELARAVAEIGDEELFDRYLTYDPLQAPVNSPEEFLHFCGALGLGKLVSEGRQDRMADLRTLASDPRWRTREAVAMALQWIGDRDLPYLLVEMEQWSIGTRFEQRAAAAGLCEPRLLVSNPAAEEVLRLLDKITETIAGATDNKSEGYKVLKKGMAYCWSVAVVAHPETGKPAMERWLTCQDVDVRWVMKENLKKARLERMDPAWLAEARHKIEV